MKIIETKKQNLNAKAKDEFLLHTRLEFESLFLRRLCVLVFFFDIIERLKLLVTATVLILQVQL